MTDEEIKEIEEVVKRSKYCNKFYKENNCNNRCPLRFKNEPYDLGFLDGFKEAVKLVKEKAAKVKEWYKDLGGDFNYEEGGKAALDDLIEEIER